MNKTKLTTKGISLLVSLIMLLSLFPAQGLAAWTDDPLDLSNTSIIVPETTTTNMPEMKLVLVKANDEGTGYEVIDEIDESEPFLVAVQANNFDRFVKNTYGMFALSTSVVYDTRYLEPTKSNRNQFKSQCQSLLEADENSFLSDNNLVGGYSIDTYYNAQTLKSTETSTLSNDNSKLSKVVTSIVYTADNETDPNEQLHVIQNGEFIAIYEFKVKSDKPSAGSAGLALSASSNIVLALQNTGLFNKTYTANGGLHKYMKLTDTVNLFPAPSTDYLDSLALTTGATKELNKYIEGQAFDPTGLVLTPHKTETGDLTPISGFSTSDFKNVKFYVDEAGKSTATPPATTRELKGGDDATELATTDNGKHVYASYTLDGHTAIADLGEITVAAKKVSSLTIKTGSTFLNTNPATTYYTTTQIRNLLKKEANPETLTVTISYDNGKDEDVVYSENANSDFVKKGLALVRTAQTADTDANPQIAVGDLVEIGDTEAFENGTNKISVAYIIDSENDSYPIAAADIATKVKKTADLTVTAQKDSTVVTAYPSTGGAKLSYAADDKVSILPATKLTAYDKSAGAGSAADKAVSAIGYNNLKFYYGDTNDAAYDAAKVITVSNTTTGATDVDFSDVNGKYLMVVSWDPETDTAVTGATPVNIGQFAKRAVSTKAADVGEGYTVSDFTASKTYGDKLSTTGAKLAVKYDNGDTATLALADMAGEDVTMKIVKNGEVLVANATPDTVLDPTMDGATIQFFKGETKIGETGALAVAKKQVKVILDSPANPSKAYDATTDVEEADVTALNIKLDADDFVSNEDKTAYAEITADGLGFTYDDKKASTGATKTINVSGITIATVDTIASAGTAKTNFDKYYVLVPGSVFVKTGNNYALDTATVKGEITKATLNITLIDNVPTYYIGSDAPLGGDVTVANGLAKGLTTTNSNIKSVGEGTSAVVDDVKLTYHYAYDADKVGSKGTPNVTITNVVLDGNDKDNYTLGTLPETTKGNVDWNSVNKIELKKDSTYKDKYMYDGANGTKLDIDELKINVFYGDGTLGATEMTIAEFLTAGGTISVMNKAGQTQNITADNCKGDADSIQLPYGKDVAISFSMDKKDGTSEKAADTLKVQVDRKPIKLSDIVFEPEKVYGSNDVTKNFEFKDTAGVLADDKAKIKVDYDASFDGNDVALDNDKKPTTKSNTTISNIKLASADGTATNFDDYVIVEDDGVTPITTDKTTTTDEGEITQAEQTAPEKPVVTIDPATNHIKITSPVSTDDYEIEYTTDKDGGKYYTKDEFEALDRDPNTTYTVKARKAQSADGNYAPSADSDTQAIKTLTYRIDVRRKGYDTIVGSGYTDETTVKDASAIHEIIGGKPSSFKAYYTDAEATTAVEYDFSIANAAKNNVVELYYTRSSGGSGGGGGGTSSYTVKFNAGEDGVISSGKTSVSVNKDNTVPDESVPTVTAKTGYKFVGWSTDGTTIVDPTTQAVTKAVTYTAVYEEIVIPTQAPSTPKPTDTPVIDENYTKPYASGYEDGSFRPNGNITRAELAAMIARLSYGDDLPDGVYYSSFSDVNDDAWFAKYVGYLEDKDVLSGYEDGTFRPNEPVTRGEISAVITRAQRLALNSYTGQFVDVTDSDWAKDYIQTLADNDIASGYEDGTFGPYNPLTRAEAVTMINKVLAPSEAVVTFTPNDIAGHWAYDQILLAVNERRLFDSPAAPVEEPAEEPVVTEEPAETEETAVEETTEAESETTNAEATAEPEAEAAAE